MKGISSREFARLVERHGWRLLRVAGSHHIYGKAGSVVRLSIPHSWKSACGAIWRSSQKFPTATCNDCLRRWLVAAFHNGLNETGHVEGRNVAIEYRWAQLQYDRLPALAADLVARRVMVIAATGGGISPLAAKAATATIPIVFVAGDLDPVNSGLVASLNRPGGNITGELLLLTVLGAKRLELLRQLVPSAAVFGVLLNPTNPGAAAETKDLQEGCPRARD